MIDRSGNAMLLEFPKEYSKSIDFCKNISIKHPIDNIVMAGMGGSSFPSAVCKTYLEELSIHIPIHLCSDYSLNVFTTSQTLVFISSISGNTEEAIDCFLEAINRKCQIVVITSGGLLLELATIHNIPIVQINKETRCGNHVVSTGYFIGSILSTLEKSGLIHGTIKELKRIENFLYGLNVRRKAKEIAKKMVNKIPLIYTTARFEDSIARAIRIRLAEVAKIPVFSNVFPDLTHYEPMSLLEKNKDFHFVLIVDPNDHSKTKSHIAAFDELYVKRFNISITRINMVGNNLLQQIVGVLYLFEWVSMYTAALKNVDPFLMNTTIELKNAIDLMNKVS